MKTDHFTYQFDELVDDAVIELANHILWGMKIYVSMRNRAEALGFINGYLAGLKERGEED
jgi:hypothetical protein